ncbi:MAG: hypothetical protein AABZ71_08230 [Candidatus Binatota bacterium]
MYRKKNLESLPSRQAAGAFPASGGSGWAQSGPGAEERAFSLFEPDILLPTQYFATTKRKDHLEPEKKLMLAVLEDAIWCFQHSLLARDKRRKVMFSEAEEWIMEEDGDSLFSFESICEVLGLNPKYVREGLMRWQEKEFAKRPRARIYRLGHRDERKKAKAPKPTVIGHKFLKAAGF